MCIKFPGSFQVIKFNSLSSISMVLPFGGVGTTKALSSTSLRGSVTSTLFPADTTRSLSVVENNTGLQLMPKVKHGNQKTGTGQTMYSTGDG